MLCKDCNYFSQTSETHGLCNVHLFIKVPPHFDDLIHNVVAPDEGCDIGQPKPVTTPPTTEEFVL